MSSDIYNEQLPKYKSRPTTAKNISRESHTPKSSKGLGDYYGTAIKAKIGRQIEGVGFKGLGKEKLKTPPKQVA